MKRLMDIWQKFPLPLREGFEGRGMKEEPWIFSYN